MLRKRFIFQTLKATMIMWSGYSNNFYIVLDFLDTLRITLQRRCFLNHLKFVQVYVKITSTSIGLVLLRNEVVVHMSQIFLMQS